MRTAPGVAGVKVDFFCRKDHTGIRIYDDIAKATEESNIRYVAHLLYATPISRGDVMVAEVFLLAPGVEIEVNVPEKVKKMYQIPDGKKLDFARKGNKLIVKVPTFTMHTGIVLEY